jgi:hypothetical protein
MNEQRSDSQAVRVEQLEAEIRRLRSETRKIKRFGLTALLGIVSIAGLCGAAAMQIPPVIAARSFVVLDPLTNKERIRLGINNQGSAGIWLNDEDGGTHIFLDAGRNGENSAMQIFDIDRIRKLFIFVGKNNQSISINGKTF